MGEWLVEEDMTETAAELIIFIIADFQDPVLHPEGIPEVFVQFMAPDLDLPACKVLPVK